MASMEHKCPYSSKASYYVQPSAHYFNILYAGLQILFQIIYTIRPGHSQNHLFSW